MSRVSRALDALFERHKFVRRAMVLWAVWLITEMVLNPPEYILSVSGPGRDVILGVVGLLTIALGFYKWSRRQEDKQKGEP